MNPLNSTVSFHLDASQFDKIAAILTILGDAPGKPGNTPPADTATPKTGKATTLAATKKAMMAAKKEHGEDFCMEVMEGTTSNEDGTLQQQLTACDGDTYDALIAAFEAGPEADDDDDDEDEDAETELDPDAVVKACRAYAKEHSRKELKDALKALKLKIADVAEAEQADLVRVMKAIT